MPAKRKTTMKKLKGVRERIKWTDKEVEAVKEGFYEYGTDWIEIRRAHAQVFHPRRTNVDLQNTFQRLKKRGLIDMTRRPPTTGKKSIVLGPSGRKATVRKAVLRSGNGKRQASEQNNTPVLSGMTNTQTTTRGTSTMNMVEDDDEERPKAKVSPSPVRTEGTSTLLCSSNSISPEATDNECDADSDFLASLDVYAYEYSSDSYSEWGN